MLRIKWFFLILISIIFQSVCYGDAKDSHDLPTVNMLVWWGYMDKPWIAPYIREKCGVNLSFDEYYTNSEFQKRWSEHKDNYDIIIFEDTFYNPIEKELKRKGSDLSALALNYYPYVRKQFYKKNYPKNVMYFFQSASGFLWNPKLLSVTEEVPVEKIFSNAKGKSIIILDDPFVVLAMLDNGLIKNEKSFNVKKFDRLTQGTNYYIINEYSKIFESENFAFSYIWSGDAIDQAKKSHNNYLFIIGPKFSYVSSDLIAQLTATEQSTCVSRVIAGKDFLNKLQNDTYYFSPYGDMGNVTDAGFKKIYGDYLENLPSLKWIPSISDKQYEAIDEEWKFVKMQAAH